MAFIVINKQRKNRINLKGGETMRFFCLCKTIKGQKTFFMSVFLTFYSIFPLFVFLFIFTCVFLSCITVFLMFLHIPYTPIALPLSCKKEKFFKISLFDFIFDFFTYQENFFFNF